MVNYHLHMDPSFFLYQSHFVISQLWQEIVKNYVVLDFSFLVCQSFDLRGCCLQSMSVQLGSNRGIILRAIETPLNAAEEDTEKEERNFLERL